MRKNEKSMAQIALLSKIDKREAVVGIIGLGYVGLPLAIHFGQEGFKVIGFDVDVRKIDMLHRGESYIKHIQMGPINDRIKNGHLEVTVDFKRLKEADCILICVPTPLTDKMEPDLSYLLDTTKTISGISVTDSLLFWKVLRIRALQRRCFCRDWRSVT